MSAAFDLTFRRLRDILHPHATNLTVAAATPDRFTLGVLPGPATLSAWAPALKARMQGKTCFNFRTVEEIPVAELEAVTTKSIEGMCRAGYIP